METKRKVKKASESERCPTAGENFSGHTLGKGLRSRVESGLVWLGPAGCHSPNPVSYLRLQLPVHIQSKAVKFQSPAKRAMVHYRFFQHHLRPFILSDDYYCSHATEMSSAPTRNKFPFPITICHSMYAEAPGRGPDVRIPAAG